MQVQPPDHPFRHTASTVRGASRAQRWWWLPAGVALLVGLGALLARQGTTAATSTIEYSTFLARVDAGKVKEVTFQTGSGSIDGTTTKGDRFTTQGPAGGLPDADIARLARNDVARNYVAEPSTWLGSLLTLLLPMVLIVGAIVWMSRRAQRQAGGFAAFGRSRVRVHDTTRPTTTFDDVAGYDAVKHEIREVVDFLGHPDKFAAVGAHIPKGLLLVGPPGTGKTLFARAIAGEAGVPFLSITASEFLEMFVGVGAARVRDLFDTARKQHPCIVFIDEIDAIGRKRGAGLGGGQDEREQTLNQILSEMDGFEVTEGIVVLAATNRPDILDPALLRAGRFDRQVVIPLPSQQERTEILAVHAKGKHLAPDVDLDLVARGTPGMSGADLANLVNEAALATVRRGAEVISAADFETARDRLLLGLERSALVVGPEEQRVLAAHEAGHALVAHLLEHADPVHKVTILPAGLSLGSTQQLPERERVIEQRPALDDALAVRLAGRTAEEIVFGVASTGAHDDLVQATELARRMVREWGMSPKLGHLAWGSNSAVFLGEDLVQTRDYSDETARLIDSETEKILEAQAARARDCLERYRAALDAIAAALVERETLSGADVADLVEAAHAPRLAGIRP
ncbi:MAG TPA: ATP-dependent zinc metalloprotease FtsH [Microthrixaceae bacterium]|nr:ATP-dependent zinc metalloprotease FtsH [Microthrixaceae bacterium]